LQTSSVSKAVDSHDLVSAPHHVMSPSTRARWEEAVASELAKPGVVELVPVLKNNVVIDFCCTSATPRGAALIGSLTADIVGFTLTELVGSWPRAHELVRAYKEVHQCGAEVAFFVEGPGATHVGHVQHHIVRTPTGLMLMLTLPTLKGT
jgi:hypothetical protein